MTQNELFLFNYLKEEILKYSNILPSNHENQKYFNAIYKENLSLEDNLTKVWSFVKDNFSKNMGSTLLRLPFQEKTIELNMQQVDLLNIVSAKNMDELKIILKSIENVKINPNSFNADYKKITPNDFDRIKKQCFKMYKNSLISQNTRDLKNKLINKRIDYIASKAHFKANEQSIFMEIIKFADDLDNVPILLNKKFGKKKTSQILNLLKAFNPLAEKGILENNYEDFLNFYGLIHKFNSVIFRNEFSYKKIVNADNTLYFNSISKCLEFARSHNLTVKLPSLIEFKSFNSSLCGAKKAIIFDKLELYIDSLTKYLEKYNKENGFIVTTITLFDELLEAEIPFRMRNLCENKEDKGWFNKLDLNQLLNLVSIVKTNMHNVKCLYADTCLMDKNKRIALFKLLNNINSMKPNLIDGIGYKMYLDEKVNYLELEETIKDLNLIGYPIYIEEFDLSLTNNFVNTHSSQECLTMKEEIYQNIENAFYNLTNYIVSFSILNINSNCAIKTLDEHSLNGFFSNQFTELSKTFFANNKCLYNYYVFLNDNFEENKNLIEKAISKGYKYLGFVKKANIKRYTIDNNLLNYDEVNDFVKTIKSLRSEYNQIKIYSGLIVDYDKESVATLLEYQKKVDYLILEKINSNNYIEAINSGLFNIVSELKLDNLSSEEKESFCESLKRLGLPLGIVLNTQITDYAFYKRAISLGCQIMFENTFKTPILFDKNDELLSKLKNELQLKSSNIVSNNYDINLIIKNNKELENLLNKTKETVKSDEFYIVNTLLNENSFDALNKENTTKEYSNLLSYTKNLKIQTINKEEILNEVEKKYNPRQIIRRKKMGYTYTFYIVLITGVIIAITSGIAFVLLLK